MRLDIILIGIALLLTLLTAARGEAPIQHMTPQVLGTEYSLTLRGQGITDANVLAQEQLHMVSAYYAPIPYALFSLGAGADRMQVEEYSGRRFEGRYGFAPSAGLAVYSPPMVNNILRITAGADVVYLNSADTLNYKYSGPIFSPSLGLVLHAGEYMNLEIGGRGHIIKGTMENTETGHHAPFSNVKNYRGYLAFTAVAPNGVYLQINFDASSAAAYNGLQNGPQEAAIAFNIGFLVKQEKVFGKKKTRESDYFPAYKKMKERQEKMEEEIE